MRNETSTRPRAPASDVGDGTLFQSHMRQKLYAEDPGLMPASWLTVSL